MAKCRHCHDSGLVLFPLWGYVIWAHAAFGLTPPDWCYVEVPCRHFIGLKY
jgi:hypothetical protein